MSSAHDLVRHSYTTFLSMYTAIDGVRITPSFHLGSHFFDDLESFGAATNFQLYAYERSVYVPNICMNVYVVCTFFPLFAACISASRLS